MVKKIWILNHYATSMFYQQSGRHYSFAKILISRGMFPVIFCAATIHNSNQYVDTNNNLYKKDVDKNNIPFVFIKSIKYTSNNFRRILNILSFTINLIRTGRIYAKENGIPDVIYASSVHPLTLVAGLYLAHYFNIRCVCEIRDLWPESIAALNMGSRKNPLVIFLYALEKWIYTKADKIIFTMEGGKDYIIENGWYIDHGGPVDLNKVHYINNGVDLEQFDYNKAHYLIEDEDLNDQKIFKCVYTGSIRRANCLEYMIDVADYFQNQTNLPVKFLIWGAGDQVEVIKKRISEKKLTNIILKGKVDKKYVPYILSKSDLNFFLLENTPLYKYGLSLNKSFDYLASGKPLLFIGNAGYSMIERYKCGIHIPSCQNISSAITNIINLPKEEYNTLCDNSRKASLEYDFNVLCTTLTNILHGNV